MGWLVGGKIVFKGKAGKVEGLLEVVEGSKAKGSIANNLVMV